MPTLWPYLHQLQSTKSFLAFVVAIYSCGEAIGALVFGYLSTSMCIRRAMLLATIIGTVGSALYGLAQPFPGRLGPVMVLLARLMQGLWTGAAQALQTVYLAQILPPHALTPAIMTLNAFACLGFVAGPVLGLAFSVLPSVPLPGPFIIDELTAPGYFVLLSGFVCIWLVFEAFDSRVDHTLSPVASPSATHGGMPFIDDAFLSDTSVPLLYKNDSNKHLPDESSHTLPLAPLIVCNVIAFVHFFGFALQETVTTPFVQTFYNWSVLRANALFTMAGVLALVAFGLLAPLSRVVSDRTLTASSLILGGTGFAVLCSPNMLPVWRFLLGFAIISVAFPMGRASTVGLYTKLLPMHAQGTGQGVLLAVGAISRILGPFFAVGAIDSIGGGLVVFGGTAAAFMACLVAMCANYRRLNV